MEATGPLPPASPPSPVVGLGVLPLESKLDASLPTTSLSLRDKPVKEARIKRSSPSKGGGPGAKDASTGKWTSKSRFTSSATTKPLLPASERKSNEEATSRNRSIRKKSEDKFDITPDGGSASRDGRQFTVSNVGNNGRIYLRPSVRPPHQRQQQPNFVFPMTPPTTASLDALTKQDTVQQPPVQQSRDSNNLNESVWTPTPSTPRNQRPNYFQNSSHRPTGHRRAISDSTTREESDAGGGFKIVISKPQEEQRARTMEDLNSHNLPFLDIDIPHYRIGNPRFSVKGTPMLRGSSYAPTETEFTRTSNVSFVRSQQGERTPRLGDGWSKKPTPISVPQQLQFPSSYSIKSPQLASPQLAPPYRTTYLSTHVVIEPSMFDELTFKPECDDKAVVRYTGANNVVSAATPPRLVAEITSPSFVDYELLSDFFLTYRSFLESEDLLRMLIARLRWALARDDEPGMVGRVRTFVAIRHWILNYFMDDFVVDYALRVSFCNLLNEFVDELSQDAKARKVQLKILGELKKCWRRVCAQYWDGPEFDPSLPCDAPVAPGGVAGHRDASLDPSIWESDHDDVPPRLSGLFDPPKTTPRESSFHADVSRAGQVQDHQPPHGRPTTPEQRPTDQLERQQTSPQSILSLDVVSCSLPGKAARAAQHAQAGYSKAAHPVPSNPAYTSASAVATTPRALTGKRVRPTHSHKRNGSLTDSLREKQCSTDKIGLNTESDYLTSFPYAGSLVRGNLLPPGQPFVEMGSASFLNDGQRQTTIFQSAPTFNDRGHASAMSGQGMRRLIGSVRRHLSTRGQGVSPTQGNFINISPLGPRGITTNRLPGTAIVPQARPRQNGYRPLVRVDLLGAEIAEDFKKAVREDAAAEAQSQDLTIRSAGLPMQGRDMNDLSRNYRSGHSDPSGLQSQSAPTTPAIPQNLRPTSDAAITTGSKSIVIVDDTVPMGLPVPLPPMPTALSSVHNSIDMFGDNLVASMAGPTPPITPPEQPLGTPRRSSHFIHNSPSSLTAPDQLPPFVPDLETLGKSPDATPMEGNGRLSGGITRPSTEFAGPASRNTLGSSPSGMHKRQQSSRTTRSINSILHRRIASLQSNLEAPSTIKSFDATTCSEGISAMSQEPAEDPTPGPLRVLRRRPGGDLRAARNVGELDALPLRKSQSVCSLTTYSESLRSSYLLSPEEPEVSPHLKVATDEFSPGKTETFSVGALAEKSNPVPRDLSLFSTHSSKPVMRPSFEAEAQKLAQIPDDDDDGGIESALAKLEGTYEKRSPGLSTQDYAESVVESEAIGVAVGESEIEREEKKEHRHLHVGTDGDDDVLHHGHQRSHQGHHDTDDKPTLQVPRTRPTTEQGSFLSDHSGGSYYSLPLLERTYTEDGRSKTNTNEWRDRSILFGPDDPSPASTSAASREDLTVSDPSFELVTKTLSMERMKPGHTVPPHLRQHHDSFLDDDSINDTDLSSELSVDMQDSNSYPAGRSTLVRNLPSHPLGESMTVDYDDDDDDDVRPPSPPMTLVQALQMSPPRPKEPRLHDHQLWSQKPMPPTPDTTPTAPQHPVGPESVASNNAESETTTRFAAHLPFILAFDSEILAQQFTLIEKDALNEIDWKELIDMNWKNAANNDSRSWVDFLRNTDAHGVEVVIARFNIMVKWVCSEIVLTQDVEERARCIIKFIHIAAHCRRYRNFATMNQIAIALTSQEVSRLTKTWLMVPQHDLQTLQELENLVSPTRNFYNLRAEMEAGSDSGCIPFVGIYTHDLLFNAQRPSEIASSPTTAPLVNFERCRYAAAIVKTLLRLLEASTLYEFHPVEGITERCLWMSALSDDDIRKHSELLE